MNITINSVVDTDQFDSKYGVMTSYFLDVTNSDGDQRFLKINAKKHIYKAGESLDVDFREDDPWNHEGVDYDQVTKTKEEKYRNQDDQPPHPGDAPGYKPAAKAPPGPPDGYGKLSAQIDAQVFDLTAKFREVFPEQDHPMTPDIWLKIMERACANAVHCGIGAGWRY